MTVTSGEFFTLPWPGPGNSEGPVNPEGWIEVEAFKAPPHLEKRTWEAPLLATSPWPGPGDSEGALRE
jgi:hypothetical protein